MGTWLARIVGAVALLLGALAVAATPASAGGGAQHCPDPLAEATGTQVEMKDACFTPTVLHARTGQDITFTNLDAVPHNIVPTGGSWGHVDDLAQGETYTTRFDEAGIYPFACSIHPGMNGAVVVTDGPASGSAGDAAAETALVAADVPTDLGGPSLWWLAVAALAGIGAGYGAATLRRRTATAGGMSGSETERASGS